jgi:hypothetical protein
MHPEEIAAIEARTVAQAIFDQTHHNECWRDPLHHSCAVRKIEELQTLCEDKEKALQMMERGLL